MAAFFDIAFGLPTVLFTAPLMMALGYWLFVMVGAVDLEILDGAAGALEGVDGAVDGALDGAMEGLDGAMEGADAALDGATEAADGAFDGDGDLVTTDSDGLLRSIFHVGKVPLTVTLTLFELAGWVSSFTLTWGLGSWADNVLSGTVIAVLSAAGGVVGGATGSYALGLAVGPLFVVEKGRSNRTVVGEIARITTGRVDATFGQAEVAVGADHLLVQVRCDRSDNGLAKGDDALVVSWNPRREAFIVEPLTTRDARGS